jgi:cell division protein FtsL
MSPVFKYILIGFTSIAGLLMIYFLYIFISIASVFGGIFERDYSIDELKTEYNHKEKEIDDLIKYFNQIKPKDKSVAIEFKNDKILERLVIVPSDTTKNTYRGWDINVKNLYQQEFKKELHWDEDQVDELKNRLDEANCISIEDGEPVKIGFKRYGMGMYFFNVFQKEETDRTLFNDGCTYILVNDKMALEYGGGAIGRQCFSKQNLK